MPLIAVIAINSHLGVEANIAFLGVPHSFFFWFSSVVSHRLTVNKEPIYAQQKILVP